MANHFLPSRLGKNLTGYAGETIDIDAVLRQVIEVGQRNQWQVEWLEVAPGLRIPVLQRAPHDGGGNAYISTGIHGDEPVGPLAVLDLLQTNVWPEHMNLWLVPCLNPRGFPCNRRENPEGIDLNRDYRNPQSPEVKAHVSWLERQPRFDLCLCLHEDWESNGFYLYEQNPENKPSLADIMRDAVAQVCPIDQTPVIENRPATNGVIRPNLDPAQRPQWPEAFYLLMNKTRLTYTLEAPSDFPMSTRVAALTAAVKAALGHASAHCFNH